MVVRGIEGVPAEDAVGDTQEMLRMQVGELHAATAIQNATTAVKRKNHMQKRVRVAAEADRHECRSSSSHKVGVLRGAIVGFERVVCNQQVPHDRVGDHTPPAMAVGEDPRPCSPSTRRMTRTSAGDTEREKQEKKWVRMRGGEMERRGEVR